MNKKTILIHSTDNDPSTNEVLDWLYSNSQSESYNIRRINGNISLDRLQMSISSKTGSRPEASFFSSDINSYWFRRGAIKIFPPGNVLIETGSLSHTINSDYSDYNIFFKQLVPKGINNPRDNEINKLSVYFHAKEVGLLFPETYILNCFSEKFLKLLQQKKFVVKSLSNTSVSIVYKSHYVNLFSSTKLVTLEDALKIYPRRFLLSQFQEYIDKKYEIRTFYLNGIFRSMAIFSQQNEKTKIDFRNYDRNRPNRCVPYNLPKWYEDKLNKLMLQLNINCGSIDTIVTPDSEYYFLEVNPIGQFQWLSKNCNYFIERMIAETLLKP